MSSSVKRVSSLYDYPVFKESTFTREERKKLQQEINETKENHRQCLENLTHMLIDQNEFIPCLEENFLLGFLRASKYDAIKACNSVLKYYRHLKGYSRHYGNLSKSAVSKTKLFRHAFVVPTRMKDNSIVLFNKHCSMEIGQISFEELFYLDCCTCNYFTMCPALQLGGITAVMDFSGFTFRKLLMHTPRLVAAYINCFQSTFPLRYRSLHLINVNYAFQILYKMIYPLLNQKMKSRLVVHSTDKNFESLQIYIPPEMLPVEYGGHIEQSALIDLMAYAKEQDVEYQRQLKLGYRK